MSARVVAKTGWFWKGLHWLVVVVTFGQNRRFLDSYATTIGPVIALPPAWLERRSEAWLVALLAHEAHHVTQFRRWGFGSAWVGAVTMGFAYLFLPLPIGFAYFRWKSEREAYAVGWRVDLELSRAAGADPASLHARRRTLIDHGVRQLTGGAYGWTWLIKSQVREWFEAHV